MIGIHGAAYEESDEQCWDGKQQQHAQLTPNIAMVDARDGAAEGIDGISSWQPRADVLEPFGQQWQRVGQQTELLREQLQRKIDRLTGVRAKTDEWETVFPEDE